MRSRIISTAAVAAAATCLMAVAGCSSSSSGRITDAVGGSSAAGPGLARAEAIVKELSKPATQFTPSLPVKKPVPRGKVIACIENPNVGTIQIDICQQAEEAAKLLGWQVKVLNENGTLPVVQNTIMQAIALKVDGIINNDSQTVQSLDPQLNAAAKAGIPVVLNSTVLPGQSATSGGELKFPIIGGHGGLFTQARQQEAIAAKLATDSNCKLHVALAAAHEDLVLKEFDQGLTSMIKGFCPSATVTVVNNQLANVGPTMNNNLVSAVQADPSINYIETDVGSFVNGLSAALRTAGLQNQVKIMGTNPGQDNYNALAAGTEAAWPGIDSSLHGWYTIDSFARYFTGTKLATEADGVNPIYMLTQASYKKLAPGASPANDLTHAQVVAAFKKDWLLP